MINLKSEQLFHNFPNIEPDDNPQKGENEEHHQEGDQIIIHAWMGLSSDTVVWGPSCSWTIIVKSSSQKDVEESIKNKITSEISWFILERTMPQMRLWYWNKSSYIVCFKRQCLHHIIRTTVRQRQLCLLLILNTTRNHRGLYRSSFLMVNDIWS